MLSGALAPASRIRVDHVRRNVFVLAACQALLFTNNSTVIAVNGLAGRELATAAGLGPGFATVPVTCWVIGGAVNAMIAAQFMKRFGRRAGFTTGASIGIFGALIAALAIYIQSFPLLCLGTFVLGAYNAFGQQYRFAAADASPHNFKAQAISLVLAGGLVGGIIGPESSKITIEWFSTKFLGAYLGLIVFMILVILVLQQLRIPREEHSTTQEPARPWQALVMQPKFAVAVLCAAFSYAVMNLLMTATPLAMTALCGHPYSAAASVIGWHVIGMFAPSFFTGSLIKRFGVLNVMFVGMLLNFVTIGIALSGVTVAHFWWSMVILGVGWNLMYIGATALLTEVYRPSERARAQGFNDFCIFLVMVVSSFSSGFLLDRNGWELLNYLSTVLLGITGAALIWLMFRTRVAPAAAA